MPYRILIYEDNKNLARSLDMLFKWQNEYELIAILSNPVGVLHEVEQYNPDVILMDIEMPGMTGVEALKEIRKVYQNLPIIMFTVFDDDENIFEAMRHGASGYILKNNFDQLISSVSDVMNGGAPMTGSVAKKVLQLFAHPRGRQKNSVSQKADLTLREKEILDHLVKGYSYKMIASEMDIALETVRAHIKKIYKKLSVNSATEAVSKVLRGR